MANHWSFWQRREEPIEMAPLPEQDNPIRQLARIRAEREAYSDSIDKKILRRKNAINRLGMLKSNKIPKPTSLWMRWQQSYYQRLEIKKLTAEIKEINSIIKHTNRPQVIMTNFDEQIRTLEQNIGAMNPG